MDFLYLVHELHGASGQQPKSILELAAGPARHSLEACSRGASAIALDRCETMADYGRSLAAAHLSSPSSFQYVVGDMEACHDALGPEDTVASAWCLLGSAAHLLTTEDFVSMLSSVGQVLEDEGTLIVELPHPRETFRLEDVTNDGWDVSEEGNALGIGQGKGGILSVRWGSETSRCVGLDLLDRMEVSPTEKLAAAG